MGEKGTRTGVTGVKGRPTRPYIPVPCSLLLAFELSWSSPCNEKFSPAPPGASSLTRPPCFCDKKGRGRRGGGKIPTFPSGYDPSDFP